MMEKKLNSGFAGVMIILLIFLPAVSIGQGKKAVVKNYLTKLPEVPVSKKLQKYRMTAIYTNMDLYGSFKGKTKVTGDYTWGLPGDSVAWNNIYIAASNSPAEPFPAGKRQEYMEGIKYVPSPKMIQADAFKNFSSSPDNIFARNLIWDMFSLEIFAWNYYDSLKINVPYLIPDINGKFDMAEIGNYSHSKIFVTWQGITTLNGEMCAVIDFDAIDNKIELSMDMIKTRGTEQYWGTVLVSLETRNIEQAHMYSGTIQEIEVKGMKDKFLMKTIRELDLNKIQ